MRFYHYIFCGWKLVSSFHNKFHFSFFRKEKIHTQIEKENIDLIKKEEKHHYWYVIGEPDEFLSNTLYKKTIWNHDYVVWKNDNNDFFAMDNHCSHRGASLSKGSLTNEFIVCPYHGYEFNTEGILCFVPGLNFTNLPCHNIKSYQIREKNNWIYLNINSSLVDPEIPIFEEPEAKNPNCTAILLNVPIHAYARILSENSLDIMHIGFVHNFGNRNIPSPIRENPPKLQTDYPYHYKSHYIYNSGDNSIAKKIFDSDILEVDNEFILPHTQIVRVKFQDFISTIITFATPINTTHSHFYMKTYRSYWYKPLPMNVFDDIYNLIANTITKNQMMKTVLQDKEIVEHIKPNYMNGEYNMKYDKLANVYRILYEKIIKMSCF